MEIKDNNIENVTEDNIKNETKKTPKRNVWIKRIFLILVVFFLGRYFYKNYDSYKELDINISWSVFFIAVLFHFIYKVMQALLWHYITYLNGCAINVKTAVLTYFYSILGKYIPGKVFMLLARIPAYEEEGVPPRKVTVCFFLENVCTLLGAGFLFLISLLFFKNSVLENYRFATLGLIVVAIVMINPRIINFFLKLLEKVTKKDLQILITYPQMILLVLLFVLNWAVLGAGFYLLVYSIYPVPLSQMLYVSGVFALSVIIGILALFAPSGLGVREGIMILGLGSIMQNEYAVLISVIARLWMTFSELSVILLAWVIDFVKNKVFSSKQAKE